MRYTVRKSVVSILGKAWYPYTIAMDLEMSAHDVDNARDDDGKVTRESLELWLGSHAGDFSSITDFRASIEDGESTIDIPWSDEENEILFNDAMFGNEV